MYKNIELVWIKDIKLLHFLIGEQIKSEEIGF